MEVKQVIPILRVVGNTYVPDEIELWGDSSGLAEQIEQLERDFSEQPVQDPRATMQALSSKAILA